MSREAWRPTRIGEFLTESRVRGTNGAVADKISVKLYGKGVVAKPDDRPGSEQTAYYRRAAGQLIYSKLDFLNGAFGIVPPELDGYETTLDLPCFDVSADVDVRWLLAHVARPAFYNRFKGLASGSRKAVRVPPAELLSARIRVPPKSEQMAIAECIEQAAAARDASRRLRDRLKQAKHGTMRRLLTEGPDGEGIDHWAKMRCGRVVTSIRAGVSPRAAKEPAKAGEWGVLKTSAVSGLGFRPEENKRLDDTADWRADLQVEAGDLLMSRGNTRELVGAVALVKETPPRRLLPDLLWRVELRIDRILPAFAVHLLGSRAARRFIETEATGSSASMKKISQETLRQMPIRLPPLAEQKAIAAVGEAYDARIAAESAALKRLTALKDGLARELLSGRLRVPPALVARLADDGGG